jgi:hypothetical protein
LRQPLDLLNLSTEIKTRLLTVLCQERAIGQRLRGLRHQRQLSLEVPAERSGVSVSMLSTVERAIGRIRVFATAGYRVRRRMA